MGPIRTFLKAVERLARNGDISIDDAYRFAKQQFGEVSDLMKLQINRLFKQKQDPGIKKQKEGEVIEVSFKPGKSKYSDKVIEESPSQASGVGLESLKNPFRTGGGLDPLEGMTRTAARVVLNRRGIKIPDRADAIDVFEENFGGDALMDLKNVAEELVEKETTGNITESMGKFLEMEGMFDLKIDKTAPKAMSNKELLEKMEEVEAEDILKKFDPEDREPNAMGGINRTNFATGGIKLIGFLARKGKDLKDEIRKAMNRFMQPSGDNKLDADVILDDMFEELNVDRDMFDQKDVMDAYGEIYDNLTANTATTEFIRPTKRFFKGVEIKDPKFDLDMPFDNDAEKLAEIKMSNERFDLEGVDPRETILPSKEFDLQEGLDDLDNLNLGSKKGDVVSKQLKIMRLAEDIEPGLFEKLTDKQLDIIVKYGDRIDQDLLKNIVLDPDPSNQAAALATLDEVETMMSKGMSQDEIMNALQSTPRRKQAEGGLSYLMGM
jgi:hypothetical protein